MALWSDFYKYQFLTLCPRGHQEVAKEVKFQKFDYKAELQLILVKIKHDSTNNYLNENQNTTKLKQRRYVSMDTNDDNKLPNYQREVHS